jgi:hypothetical protein
MAIDGLWLPDVPRAWFVRPDGVDASDTIHGRGHTLRVWVHAQELASELLLAPWQAEALHYAALWHDIGRVNDHADYYHGARGAGRVIGLGLHEGLEPLVREAALFAVTHHCGSEEHAERSLAYTPDPAGVGIVFRVLWDADALDLVRLGNLDPHRLRHPQSRARVTRALDLLGEIT